MKKRWWLLAGVIGMSVGLFSSCATQSEKFQNTEIDYKSGVGNIADIIGAYVRAERAAPVPKAPLPLQLITEEVLASNESQPTVYRLGHSSVLIRLDGEYVLTDPVFSERASPVQWMGPKRFHPLPLPLQALPALKAVIISHDHYDHLDKASVRSLDKKVERFIVPTGVGKHLRDWGIAEGKITELAWWQSLSVGSLQFTATPAQHFSGRGLTDRDKTLWASWVIGGRDARIFFSGDSGYFGGFREIGERFGPFDVTLIETGAYNDLWSQVHMKPEESVLAHLDLRGRAMIPIHNSTFDLALHDWFEPLERAQTAAEARGATLLTPVIGAPVNVRAPVPTQAWWREFIKEGLNELPAGL
ncbi:MBL fold metallo-hydrolase [Microbulbifer sp. OS29]|uniref:MBL fold metallo-hydrolase n=1 Tax=Microbulbifer okhotskensis TaxID=2926617 RepID=A0A9X2ETK5_9GAMM|nr:MBL fold metallo-hydrolase [Microbulbifer okhotskensis]MCO1335558.1 MBL fold metallo-hydrolase [Microbulbifer okhotskensis]